MTMVLETSRLILREMSEGDLDFVAEMLADPEVMGYYPARLSRAEAADWVERQRDRYEEDGFGFWLVLLKTTGEPVGQVGLLLQEIDGAREVGLGYIIHRPYWRRGIAFEAAAATLAHAFDALDLERVICPIRPENASSRGLVEKLGLKLEKRSVYKGFEHLIYVASRPVIE